MDRRQLLWAVAMLVALGLGLVFLAALSGGAGSGY